MWNWTGGEIGPGSQHVRDKRLELTAGQVWGTRSGRIGFRFVSLLNSAGGVATVFEIRGCVRGESLFSRRRLEDFVASSRGERTIRPDCSYATSQTCTSPQTSLSAPSSVINAVFRSEFFRGCRLWRIQSSIDLSALLRGGEAAFDRTLPEFSRSRQAKREVTRRRG